MGDVIDSTLMHINKGNAKGTHQRGLSRNIVDYSRRAIIAMKETSFDLPIACVYLRS